MEAQQDSQLQTKLQDLYRSLNLVQATALVLRDLARAEVARCAEAEEGNDQINIWIALGNDCQNLSHTASLLANLVGRYR